ncbi:MAG TPA: hypothetical protein VNG71_06800 [Pyrinomonadaceae bacterium]|nr:hypothetical protein [Pyrinomonadaceae bacterium]
MIPFPSTILFVDDSSPKDDPGGSAKTKKKTKKTAKKKATKK